MRGRFLGEILHHAITERVVELIHAGGVIGELAGLAALQNHHRERGSGGDFLRQSESDETAACDHDIDRFQLLHDQEVYLNRANSLGPPESVDIVVFLVVVLFILLLKIVFLIFKVFILVVVIVLIDIRGGRGRQWRLGEPPLPLFLGDGLRGRGLASRETFRSKCARLARGYRIRRGKQSFPPRFVAASRSRVPQHPSRIGTMLGIGDSYQRIERDQLILHASILHVFILNIGQLRQKPCDRFQHRPAIHQRQYSGIRIPHSLYTSQTGRLK